MTFSPSPPLPHYTCLAFIVIIILLSFFICLVQQEQLAAFDMEKQILLGKSKNAEREIESLSAEYAKLLGHQNQKQKIHHVLKLKEENVTLKQVCSFT